MLLSVITFIAFPVPIGFASMSYKVYSGSIELLNQLEKASTRTANQKDERKYFFYFSQNIQLNRHADSSSVHSLAETIIEQSGYSPSQKAYRDEFRRHVLIVILNLSTCVLNRQWCKIPLKNDAFNPDGRYQKLSYKHFKRVIYTLEDIGFIELIKGAKYQGQSQRSVIQPSSSIMHGGALYAHLDSEDTSPPPYATVGKLEKDHVMSKNDIAQLAQDEMDLLTINDFLKEHTWAAKSPIKRIYSGKIGRAGRLYCNYQQLPQKRLHLRQNCLIDGEPLIEVDIKASHPRLAVALFHNKKLPRDFYYAIEELTNVYQSKVKHFCQNALSCSSRDDALSSFKKNKPNGSETDFDAVEKCIIEMYPKLPLYSGWSVTAMNYEGEILKQVMLDGVKAGIVALPVHDAVAVQINHKNWATERLIFHWAAIVGLDACIIG
jgi:hypothetical protein